MSKQRAQARAAREAAAAARVSAQRERQAEAARLRARRERRAAAWRRLRLWQHGAGSHAHQARRRDTWAALATLSLVLLLTAFLLTRSVRVVISVALVLVIAGPVLVVLSFDRRRR